MSLKTRILAAAVPLAVASVVLVGATSGASAYQCKSQPQGVVSVAANYPSAVSLGQSLWTSKVRSQFGLEWSVWTIAQAKAQNCAAAGGGMYQCSVVAKPCKYVVQ